MKQLEIYFDDLKSESQQQLLKHYDIKEPKEMNWDTIPIFILEATETFN